MLETNRVAVGSGLTVAALIVLFFIFSLSESRIKSPTSDEPPHIASGLSYIETGIFRGNPQHPPLLKELSGLSLALRGIHWPHNPTTEWFLHGNMPPGVQPEWEIGNQIISQNGADTVLFWARLPLILTACLGAMLLYVWGRQLLGGAPALAALFLFTMNPTVLAHSFLVTTDVGLAAFTILFLFAMWNYLRDASLKRLALCGLALGAALCTKFSAVILLPVGLVLLLTALVWPVEPRRGTRALLHRFTQAEYAARDYAKAKRNDRCPCGSGKKYKTCHGTQRASSVIQLMFRQRFVLGVCAFLAICAVAFLVIQAVYFFPLDPLTYYRGLALVNADHNPNYMAYMGGELQRRFPSYFAAAYILKEPIASIIFAVIGLITLIRTKKYSPIAKLFLLLPPVALFAAVSFGADNLGIRYIIPVLPFAHLLGGLGVATLVQMPAKWARIAAVVLCGWLIVAAAGIYPDHLSYFNEVACLTGRPGEIGIDGGSQCGTLWLDDSNVDWGQGLKQLKVWLDRNAPGRTIRLASIFGFPPEAYGIKFQKEEPLDLVRDPVPGLYAVSAHLVARMPAYIGASDWLRTTRPVAIVGHALYVYDIKATAVLSDQIKR